MSNLNNVFNQYKNLEKGIYAELLQAFFSNQLKVTDGKILFTQGNARLIDIALKAIESYSSNELPNIQDSLVESIVEILNADSQKYISVDVRATEISKPVIQRIKKHSTLSVKQNMVFAPLFTKVKSKIISLVSRIGGISLDELRTALQTLIINKQLVNGYFERWTYDIYNQYRRAGNDEMRKKLGLKYAVYEGGEIETTRPFCSARAGKVFSEAEIMSWKDIEFQGKPESGYNPIIDLGGYNCRHRLRWISDGLAQALQAASTLPAAPEPPELIIETVVVPQPQPEPAPIPKESPEDKEMFDAIEKQFENPRAGVRQEGSEVYYQDINEAIEQVRDFVMSAEKEAAAAINLYTRSAGFKMNDLLRFKKRHPDMSEEEVKAIEILEDILFKAPKFDGVSYRGLKFTDADKFQEFRAQFKTGGIYVDKAFMSASYNIEKANNFASGGLRGKVVLTIQSDKGVPIEKFSSFNSEAEVLHNKGGIYEILSFEDFPDRDEFRATLKFLKWKAKQ